MKREKIKAEKRKILGKQVKKLRRDGIIPANMYGKNIKSESLQVMLKDFAPIFKDAGETGLVDIDVNDKVTPVLIHNVQKDFRGNVLHADFFAVNLKEKVKAMVPVEVIGEPKAVVDKIGLLMNITDEVEVEALPENLPENIEVNVEHLAAIDDQVTVADLKAPEGVEILTDKEQVVSKIGELITKEAAAEAAAAEAAAAAAKEEAGAEATTEGAEPKAEGEATEAGEQKPEEAQKTEQPTE